MLGNVCLSKRAKYRTQESLNIVWQLFINQFFKDLREQRNYTNWAVVLLINRIIFLKIGVTFASFKLSGNVLISNDLLMQSVTTENVNSHSFKIFVCISPPTDLLLLRCLITCFTSFTEADWNENVRGMFKFCWIVLMLG